MSSFKLDTTQDTKRQLIQGGALLFILAVPIGLLIWPLLAVLMAVIGAVMMLAGRYAS